MGQSQAAGRAAVRATALSLLGALLVLGPEMIGGRPAWAVVAITALAAAAALAAGLSVRRGVGSTLAESAPLLAVTAALVWTCVQCLPLPASWVVAVNPNGVADERATALLLEAAPSRWGTISRSPWNTAEQVLHGFAIVSTFAAVWWHSIARRGQVVASAIGVSTVAMAVVALVHFALGARSAFGVYTPPVMGSMPSPLLNENHLAGFLAMGTPMLVALGLDAQLTRIRAAWWLGAVVAAATCVLCISRSGLGSLAVGLLVLAIVAIRADPRALQSKRLALGALVVGFGLLLAAVLVADELGEDLASTNLNKVRLALRGLDLVAQQPWLGIGRGAYSEAFVRLFGTSERVEQPENFVVQWASEWGLPATLALLAVLARAWLRATSTRSRVRWGALAGVASIAAHDLLDFATEVVGIAVVASALLALALAPSASALEERWSGRNFVVGVALAAAVALVALGPDLEVRRVRESERALIAAIEAHDETRFDAAFRAAVARHPGEPAFALLGAYAAIAAERPDAGRWLNRAMVLAPRWHSPHLLAARWLVDRGALGQAWLELRESERRLPGSSRAFGCELLGRPGSAEHALRVLANDAAALDRLASCSGAPTDVTARFDEVLLATDLVGPRVRMAQRSLARADPSAAVAMLEPIADSGDAGVVLTLAQAYRAAGNPRAAVELLRDGRLEPAARGEAYRELARACADAGDAVSMRLAIDRLRGSAHGSAHGIAQALELLGALEHQLGNDGHAFRAYEQAARLDPAGDGLTHVATMAESLGDPARAYRAWAEVCRRDGPSSAACAAAARLRGGG